MPPTYYVRTSGSVASNGSSPATAWKTVSHALSANGASVSGASVWVGAGVYRNTITAAVSGTAASVTAVIGDIDGAQTGDAGQVTLTAYTTNDKTLAANATLLALGTQSYLNFSLLTFIGGRQIPITNVAGGANYGFTDCVFNGNYQLGTATLSFTSASATPLGLTLDRCAIIANTQALPIDITLTTTASGGADYDARCIIRNCLITGFNGVEVDAAGTATFKGGGVRAYNCTMFVSNYGFDTNTASQLSTTIPCEIHDSVILGNPTNAGLRAATTGQLIESYNLIYATTPRTNVNAGPGSISDGSYAPLIELGQSYKWGDGTFRQFLAPDGAGSPLLGFGSSASVAASVSGVVDWQNRNRPSGGGGGVGVASVQSVGYMEFHDFAKQSTASVQAGTSSGQIVGPGDQFIQVPVDAVSSTVSIYLMFSSGYGGTNYPAVTLHAQGELGVAAQTQTCSSSSLTWQQLTFSAVTPSKQGWITLQVDSYDTSGTASVFFDTLAVA